MRFSLMLVASLAAICATSPAFAGMQVLGRSSGHQCYIATLLPANAGRDAANLKLCDSAIEESEGDTLQQVASYVNRGDIKLRLGDYTGAIDDAEKGLALERDVAEAYVNRGAGMLGLNRCQDALVILNQALALKGDKLPNAYFDRALARECLGDVKGAYLDLKKTALLNPSFQPALEELQRFRVVSQVN